MSTSVDQATLVPSVDTSLRSIIASVESNGNSKAMRFERGTFNQITTRGSTPLLITIQRINQCSSDTARVIYSMSFGAFQEMGFNIYGRHKDGTAYAKPIVDFINSEKDQQDLYAIFLMEDNINETWSQLKSNQAALDHFAVMYNGSTQYADRMLAAAKALGL